MNKVITNIKNIFSPTESIKFNLESPITNNMLFNNSILLRGWALGKENEIKSIQISLNGILIDSLNFEQHRPILAKMYKGWKNYSLAGFHKKICFSQIGDYILSFQFENGDSKDFTIISVSESNMKKIVFIHVPKAAGSSVNHLFENTYGENVCLTHLESNQEWSKQEVKNKLLSEYTYFSGHLPFEIFFNQLNFNDYYSFTFLRNPNTHVISHLSWIRRLADPSEKNRFDAHPLYIQKLAMKMLEIDFTLENDIKTFVNELEESEFNLLDNVQTRYLRKNSGIVTDLDLKDAIDTLYKFNNIGIMEYSNESFNRICKDLSLKPIEDVPHENKLKERYGLSANNETLMSILHPLIKYDLELYNIALKYFKEK